MLTRDEVKRRVLAAIGDNIPELLGARFEESTLLSEHEEVDSLGFIMVLTDLEGELGVTVPDEEWPALRTFGDLVNAFSSRLQMG